MTSSSGETRSYEDFDPVTEWKTDGSHDILELHLQGFSKEKLKVITDSSGRLAISGERRVGESKWSRFHKEIKILPKGNLYMNEIHAKFSSGSGILSIIMPKDILRQDNTEGKDVGDHVNGGRAWPKRRITVARVAGGLVAVVVLFLVAHAARRFYWRGLLGN